MTLLLIPSLEVWLFCIFIGVCAGAAPLRRGAAVSGLSV